MPWIQIVFFLRLSGSSCFIETQWPVTNRSTLRDSFVQSDVSTDPIIVFQVRGSPFITQHKPSDSIKSYKISSQPPPRWVTTSQLSSPNSRESSLNNNSNSRRCGVCTDPPRPGHLNSLSTPITSPDTRSAVTSPVTWQATWPPASP